MWFNKKISQFFYIIFVCQVSNEDFFLSFFWNGESVAFLATSKFRILFCYWILQECLVSQLFLIIESLRHFVFDTFNLMNLKLAQNFHWKFWVFRAFSRRFLFRNFKFLRECHYVGITHWHSGNFVFDAWCQQDSSQLKNFLENTLRVKWIF